MRWLLKMIRPVRCLVSLSLISAFTLGALAQPDQGRQVILGSEIELAGTVKLSDIFHLINNKSITSVDGYTYQVSVGAYVPNDNHNWTIYVDGHKTDIGVLETQSINMLGLSVASIDSIVVVSRPGVYRGEYVPNPRLEITTKLARQQNLGVVVAVGAANETGDPGPFRYTSPDNRFLNVDKRGPDRDIAVSYATGGFSLGGGVISYKLIPSDTRVFRRNRYIFDDPVTPEMSSMVPFATATWDGSNLRASSRLSLVKFDDMFFSQQINREIPVRHDQTHFNASVSSQLNQALFRASFNFADKHVDNDPRANRIPVDWSFQSIGTTIDAELPAGRSLSALGITFANSTARSRTTSINELTVRAAASRKQAISRAATLLAEASLGTGDGGSEFQTGLSLDHRTTLRSISLSAGASMAERYKADPTHRWGTRGLLFLDGDQVAYEFGSKRNSWSVYSDASFAFRLTAPSELQLSFGARRHIGVPRAEKYLVPDGTGFLPDSLSYSPSNGSAVLFSGRYSYEQPSLRLELNYRVNQPIRGADNFRSALRSIPKHQFSAVQWFRLADSFELRAAATFASKTHWADQFSFVGLEESPNLETPGFVRADVSLRKGLFNNHLNLYALVENVLNQRIQYHPFGAWFDRTLTVRASLRI